MILIAMEGMSVDRKMLEEDFGLRQWEVSKRINRLVTTTTDHYQSYCVIGYSSKNTAIMTYIGTRGVVRT